MFKLKLVFVLVTTGILLLISYTNGIDIWRGLIYSAVVVLGILLVDLIAGGKKGYKFLSSFLFAALFLTIGFFVTSSFSSVFGDKSFNIALNFIFIYIGIVVGNRNYKYVESFFNKTNSKLGKGKTTATPKLLDTSTLIDGRIANIVDTNFMEGVLVIPVFVLKELQNVADSHDHLRRQKGRRGLNVLKRLQEQNGIPVEIDPTNFDDIGTVDEKLIALGKKLSATILTTDFNLMKVAEIQNIKALNLNNLALALRQTILPGEELIISVTKEGKDPSQGVGYLDDGTMVVVEQGKKNIGEKLKVEVTSLLQTESGRIIFTRAKL